MCTEIEVRTGLVKPWLTIVGDCRKEQGLFALFGRNVQFPGHLLEAVVRVTVLLQK
jgi:hypothetical protein